MRQSGSTWADAAGHSAVGNPQERPQFPHQGALVGVAVGPDGGERVLGLEGAGEAKQGDEADQVHARAPGYRGWGRGLKPGGGAANAIGVGRPADRKPGIDLTPDPAYLSQAPATRN